MQKRLGAKIIERYLTAVHMRRQMPKEALRLVKELIEECPHYEQLYGECASLYLDMNEPDNAISLLQRVLNKNDKYVCGHVWLHRH